MTWLAFGLVGDFSFGLEWRQVLGGLNRDLPPPCRWSRGRGMCDHQLNGRARIALGRGQAQTLPPVCMTWQFLDLNQARHHDRRRKYWAWECAPGVNILLRLCSSPTPQFAHVGRRAVNILPTG